MRFGGAGAFEELAKLGQAKAPAPPTLGIACTALVGQALPPARDGGISDYCRRKRLPHQNPKLTRRIEIVLDLPSLLFPRRNIEVNIRLRAQRRPDRPEHHFRQWLVANDMHPC